MRWFPGDDEDGPEILIGDGEDVSGSLPDPTEGGCSSDPDDLNLGDGDD